MLSIISFVVPLLRGKISKLLGGLLLAAFLYLCYSNFKYSLIEEGYNKAVAEYTTIYENDLELRIKALKLDYDLAIQTYQDKANVAHRALQKLSEAPTDVEIKYVDKKFEIDDCKPLLNNMSGVLESHYGSMPTD